MMSGRARALIAEAAAVAGPLIVLSVARLLLGSTPDAVSAEGAPAPAAVVPVAAAKPLTTEQRRAAEWVKSLSRGTPLNSPMDHPRPFVEVRKDPEPPPRPVEPVHVAPVSPLSGLTLSGVLGNDSGGLAAINGRIYKVGDRVKGLVLTAIDVKGNAVELTSPDGSVLRLVRDRQ